MYTTYLYTFFYTTYLYTFRSEFIIFLIIGHTCSIFICCSCRAYKLHFVWAGTPYSNNCCYWRSCFGWWPRIGSFMWSPHMWCCLYLEHYQIPTFLWDNYFLVFEYLNAYLHSYVQGKMQNLECQKQALPLYLGT